MVNEENVIGRIPARDPVEVSAEPGGGVVIITQYDPTAENAVVQIDVRDMPQIIKWLKEATRRASNA